jgi:hypothetical protein
MDEFCLFSPLFTSDYLHSVETKILVCKELVGSFAATQELKSTTRQLTELSRGLRVKLNALDAYFKLAADGLDVPVADTGLKGVRDAISRGNTEGLLATIPKLMVAVKRNLPLLESKGFTPTLLAGIDTQTRAISTLNVRQNELISTRNRLTDENTIAFNDLWASLRPILDTAKALYRGVNPTKLKDYTVSQLRKRINAEGPRKSTTAPPSPEGA